MEPTVSTISSTADLELTNTTTKSLPQVCSENNFQCFSGECIPYHEVCDEKADCADQSDEQHCPPIKVFKKNVINYF